MPRKAHNPDGIFNSLQYGFSQVVVSGKLVFVSGQVGWNADEEIVGEGELKVQMEQSLKNLRTALESVGASLDDVTALRIYIVDTVIDTPGAISEPLTTYFGDQPPAATWIGVTRLADKAFLVEVEATAVLGS